MVKRNRAEFLTSNLPQLQNLIKRDSESYKEEFMTQWRHFASAVAIFNLKPDTESPEFAEQIMFLSQVSTCYPTVCGEYPQMIVDMLSNHYQTMSAELRKSMVQALILMRNRNLISQTSLLSLFFTLFRCNDKILRALLHSHIVSDIKNSNAKAKNNKLNKTLQNFMYTMLKDSSATAAKKSLEVMIELYMKNVWDDAKTVNVISEACFLDAPKLVAPAVHFFLGSNENTGEDSDSENDGDLSGLRHANTVNRKTKARKAQMSKAMASIKKKERAKNRAEHFNFSALHLINDPQGFTEHLFSRLRQVTTKNTFKFELRLNLINLISRLIGVHKLILLGFYDFLISYLKPQQRDVTKILANLAQSAHELVPPDALETVVRAIADNFVWSNCASEVITAGLNGLREICTRCPLAMPEELLKSLMDDYKNHRERGPMNAARSLLGLYREINPELLKKKDRGKIASINMKTFQATRYGEVHAAQGIEGADLLDEEDKSGEQESPLLDDAESDVEVDLDDENSELLEECSEISDDCQSDEEIEEEIEDEETVETLATEISPKKKQKFLAGTQKVIYS